MRYFDGRSWTGYAVTAAPVAPPPVEHPVLPFPVVVGAIVILFGSLVLQRPVIEALADRNVNVLVLMGLATFVGYGPSVLWMWFASRRWGTRRLLVDLGVRFRWSDLGWGPLVWVSTYLGLAVAVAVIQAFDVPYRGNLDVAGESRSAGDPERALVVSLIISAIVVAPVVEEALFRGLVMRGLLSTTAAPIAIVAQGLLFGAAHFQPDFGVDNIGLLAVLSLVGIGFGTGSYLLRRLGPAVIAHACFNTVAVIVLLVRVY